ncbi:coiled-coil domain-containing protein 66 [Notechis scutatus]|uniref:Coiled-coil domain-containing protein 66 n=1 Tax=Notechis scutatus TaxID=8663 RepID=A0A6J1UY13_9SAUR|nr:coiled-coil domain-containing protein 66 [Notechis scutatus]
MNLGDGLKLETEILDGKPRLIVAPCVSQSKPGIRICNKNKILKYTTRSKPNGHILKSVQTSCEKNECLTKQKTRSRFSVTKGSKHPETVMFTKDLSKGPCNKDDAFIIQKDNTTSKPDNVRNSIKKPLACNKKFKKHSLSVEDRRDNLVCLTQEQLEQILMAVKEGTQGATQVLAEKKGDANTKILDNPTSEEHVMGLLQKVGDAPSLSSESSFCLKKNQGLSRHAEQKIITNSWKPADIFSTLGERESDKILLDAKKSQWKKELDEQVALKKKLKETLEAESRYHQRQAIDTVKRCLEKGQKMMSSDNLTPAAEDLNSHRISTTEPSETSPSVSSGRTEQFSSFSSPDLPAAIRTAFVLGEATPIEHPFSAVKREQQKKWLEELDKQKEADKLRKMEEKCNFLKGEEHDKWTMHFDSFKNHMNSFIQYPLNTTYQKTPEAVQLSHDHTACSSSSCLTPTEIEIPGKAVGNYISEPNQKASFLRSMTALLDPAQIEERGRRRQKQLEHQKAIMAQVEEKRKKKQVEEEQRRMEEQEEEHRLAREQELMKKQFEEDLLKQKLKEEIMTLKTNELYQTMQKAQELAQRLKQEQRIKSLAQKGHDTSKLQKNLGDTTKENNYTDLNGVLETPNYQKHCFSETNNETNERKKSNLSPQKDTAVQTEFAITDFPTDSEISPTPAGEGRMDCASPDVAVEYIMDFSNKRSKKEEQYLDKKISEKENIISCCSRYEQCPPKQKHPKAGGKNGEKMDWNINKPCKRYIPASEKYPRLQQKQREEKKAQRQMALLQLVERNTPGNLCKKNGVSPDRALSPRQEDEVKSKEEQFSKKLFEQRSDSPPVPAVKNRLQQQLKTSDFPVHNSKNGSPKSISTDQHRCERPLPTAEAERPPSSHFVPYVRTNEIYYLDPDAPLTRPSTHEPQYQELNDTYHKPRQVFSSDHIRDPLFNPNTVRDRQQAILKGLSELREGLLQKQKELETCLIPSLTSQEENFILPL